jgi:aldose 1-epimerase
LSAFHLDGFDHSLTLGSPDPACYSGPLRYFGAIVGPIANRIAKGIAPLDGSVLHLDTNEAGSALHGGPDGLSQQVWAITKCRAESVTFGYHMPDGAGGLPGPIDFAVTYDIEEDGAFRIAVTARSATLTLCNPAFHGYWSLTGQGLAGHRLTIDADHYLPVDAALIPTGTVAPVAGTAYDLRQPTPLPASVDLDTNFCLNGEGLREVARLETDRLVMVVETDAPGLQVYDAARMDTAPAKGHHGAPYGAHSGIALEPQFWPDAPNHPDFPPITLRPGAPFSQTSRFRFIRKETP